MATSFYRTSLRALGLLALTCFVLTSCKIEDIKIEGVESVKINTFDESGFNGEVTLRITNPNVFPVTVSGASFKVVHKAKEIGETTLEEPFKITANSTGQYPVKVKGGLGGLFMGGVLGIVGMLTGGNPVVTLKGEVQAKAFLIRHTVPVELETELPVSGLIR